MGQFDVAIIGSGAIGLGIARGLIEIDPSLKITVYEKEAQLSSHASARNSGVLHAGFYYSPNSLKAQFCRDGRDEFEKIILDNNLPFKKVGKVVVTQSSEEENRLATLVERGIANGVKIERLPGKELSKFEPLARTFESFLWSPQTSISDPELVNKILASQLEKLGVVFCTKSQIQVKDGVFLNHGENIQARYFINAAGAGALAIAKNFNVGNNFEVMPFLGLYKKTDLKQVPLSRLVYPVPHPINPFLGVHLTLTIKGEVKIGPSALPIIGLEQYSLSTPITFDEFRNFASNMYFLSKGDKHNLGSMISYEVPKLLTRNLVNAAAPLVPAVKNVKKWRAKSPGIRAQLINRNSGELVQDFLIEHHQNTSHVLNAVSPGWTASIPFGKYVAHQVIERLNS